MEYFGYYGNDYHSVWKKDVLLLANCINQHCTEYASSPTIEIVEIVWKYNQELNILLTKILTKMTNDEIQLQQQQKQLQKQLHITPPATPTIPTSPKFSPSSPKYSTTLPPKFTSPTSPRYHHDNRFPITFLPPPTPLTSELPTPSPPTQLSNSSDEVPPYTKSTSLNAFTTIPNIGDRDSPTTINSSDSNHIIQTTSQTVVHSDSSSNPKRKNLKVSLPLSSYEDRNIIQHFPDTVQYHHHHHHHHHQQDRFKQPTLSNSMSNLNLSPRVVPHNVQPFGNGPSPRSALNLSPRSSYININSRVALDYPVHHSSVPSAIGGDITSGVSFSSTSTTPTMSPRPMNNSSPNMTSSSSSSSPLSSSSSSIPISSGKVPITSSKVAKPRGRPRKIRPNSCAICNCTSTPEWRKGDNGANLCNACGLQYMKKLRSSGSKPFFPGGHYAPLSPSSSSTPSPSLITSTSVASVQNLLANQSVKYYQVESYSDIDESTTFHLNNDDIDGVEEEDNNNQDTIVVENDSKSL